MKNPVPIFQGLIIGMALYILIMKSKKKPCECPETQNILPTVVEPKTNVPETKKDVVLETAIVPPIVVPPTPEAPCKEAKPFPLYIGDEQFLIDWYGVSPRIASYKLVLSGTPTALGWLKVGVIPKYQNITPEQYEKYCRDYRAGLYSSPNLNILPDPKGIRQTASY